MMDRYVSLLFILLSSAVMFDMSTLFLVLLTITNVRNGQLALFTSIFKPPRSVGGTMICKFFFGVLSCVFVCLPPRVPACVCVNSPLRPPQHVGGTTLPRPLGPPHACIPPLGTPLLSTPRPCHVDLCSDCSKVLRQSACTFVLGALSLTMGGSTILPARCGGPISSVHALFPP